MQVHTAVIFKVLRCDDNECADDERICDVESDKSTTKRKLFPEIAPISSQTTLVFLEIYYLIVSYMSHFYIEFMGFKVRHSCVPEDILVITTVVSVLLFLFNSLTVLFF